MSATDSTSAEGFFEALLGGLAQESEPDPGPTAQELRESAQELGELIQDQVAIAVGVRARAVEGGIAPESADVMALSTYGLLLQSTLGSANG